MTPDGFAGAGCWFCCGRDIWAGLLTGPQAVIRDTIRTTKIAIANARKDVEAIFILAVKWLLAQLLVRPLGGFGRRGRCRGVGVCRWANGYQFFARQFRRQDQNARAYRWTKDSCRRW